MYLNLASVRCDEDGCRLLASWGHPGGPRGRCRARALDSMVRMSARRALRTFWVVV